MTSGKPMAPSPARSRPNAQGRRRASTCSSATPNAGSIGETDDPQPQEPRALTAGLVPIMCVGETERARSQSDLRRPCKQVERASKAFREQLDSSSSPTSPSGPSAPARRRTKEQAQEAHLHPLRGSKVSRPGRPPRMRILYGGCVKPDNMAELMASPKSTVPSSAAPA